ncbi:hypothetical protein BN1723_015693 [Verticillium longisporum]|uniref:Uncharacterized protein n=1 Tax=Verticillium longisporum TaxID=100787 RepID=A0A0G4N1Q5_VERLO|nr:hypothetical protein BN1723_015693 [Verticillium longisporum]
MYHADKKAPGKSINIRQGVWRTTKSASTFKTSGLDKGSGKTLSAELKNRTESKKMQEKEEPPRLSER